MQDSLTRINGDLDGTSVNIELEPRYIRTKRNPKGGLKDIDIFISVVPRTRLEQMLALHEEKGVLRGYQRPDRQKKREAKRGRLRKEKPAPADTSNVTAINPRQFEDGVILPLVRPKPPVRPTGATSSIPTKRPDPDPERRPRTLEEMVHIPRPKPPQRPPNDD